MGAQRLLQVRNSKLLHLSQVAHLLTIHRIHSNSQNLPRTSKSTSLDLSLTFNLGLENMELVMKWYVRLHSSFIQMRSFMDPIEDYGTEFSKDPGLNTDTQIASLSLPFVLPNDFSLVFSHLHSS